jgi:hypothetical protein
MQRESSQQRNGKSLIKLCFIDSHMETKENACFSRNKLFRSIIYCLWSSFIGRVSSQFTISRSYFHSTPSRLSTINLVEFNEWWEGAKWQRKFLHFYGSWEQNNVTWSEDNLLLLFSSLFFSSIDSIVRRRKTLSGFCDYF